MMMESVNDDGQVTRSSELDETSNTVVNNKKKKVNYLPSVDEMTIAPDEKLAQIESKEVMVELTKVDKKESKPKKLNLSLKKDVVVKLIDIASQMSEQKPITIDQSSDEHSDVEPSDSESEINKPNVTKQSLKAVKSNMINITGKASEVASAKKDEKSD